MNTAPAGFFSTQVNSMDASSKLPYFPADFIGVVKVAACKGITTRDGARAFIVELEILQSNLDTVRVGGKYSWYQSLKEPGTAYPSCIAFLYACLGLDSTRDRVKIETEVKPKQDQWLNAAVSDKNVLANTTVCLQTSNTKMKDKVSDFTIHNFSPYFAKAQ